MFDINVEFNDEERTITINGINSNNLPGKIVSIPNDNPKRKKYISLFLHRADVITARDFLNEISSENHARINESLFVSALIYLYRCFQQCEKRIELNIDDLVLVSKDTKDSFHKYRNIRNKHFAHDQNSMIETFDFLLLTSIQGEKYDRIEACVVYERHLPDFVYHAKEILSIIDQVLPSIEILIDKVAAEIIERYKEVPISDILNFATKEPRFANMNDVFSKRLD